jgi:UDP:flavonoid glycosyltransferase YjiC (YdhE family)
VRLPRRFISPRPLRRAVEQVLGEPSIRARAHELAHWVSSHDAGTQASQLVEQLVGSPEVDGAHQTKPLLLRRA